MGKTHPKINTHTHAHTVNKANYVRVGMCMLFIVWIVVLIHVCPFKVNPVIYQ